MISIPASPSAAAAPQDLAPVAESPAMREAARSIQEVAPAPTTVLLLGARGTGRGRLAWWLHALSGRTGPLVEIDCAPQAERMLPSLRPALAQAAGGTLVLREVGALRGAAQAILARALQDRAADADAPRIVATATPDLAARAEAGAFRSDLFYRLHVFPVVVPSLGDRAEDLAGLVASILREDALPGAPVPALADDALAALRGREYEDGIPELARRLRQARALGGAQPITAAALFGPRPPRAAFPADLPLDLGQLERLAIEEALRRAGGNRTKAARLLRIGLRTLRNKLRAWREAGEEVPHSPHARPDLPVPGEPGADVTAAILARAWARRSQERQA
ncbi:MAG TPA: sigma 54-interacting transcriptional regulator [Anaeromyxobacter sp.]|nr:sigma 54-interacting transcriptional regulator [Anaeromyxobacter sp.]